MEALGWDSGCHLRALDFWMLLQEQQMSDLLFITAFWESLICLSGGRRDLV